MWIKRASRRSYRFLAAASVLALCVYFALRHSRFMSVVDAPALVREIQQIHELGSVRYSVQKVVGMREQKVPVGTESLLIVVQGRVVAGIDLSGLKPADVAEDRDKMLVVKLPQARILHSYIDEQKTQVWDRRITWWTPWIAPNPDLERQARLQALKEIESTALEMGILKDAETNAQMTIKSLLRAFGIEQVEFRPLS